MAGHDLKAVLFDVDFTLVRPGPELGPEGYLRVARRYGSEVDVSRYDEARAAALETLEKHPDFRHDEEIWVQFTERIVLGMGGDPANARAIAVEVEQAWERSENFDIYEDVEPALDELRGYGLLIGLVSNGARDLREFVRHHGLDADVTVASRYHGTVKPDPSIFRKALDRLGVEPAEAAMVGDHLEDDFEGARALGMRAVLIDRENRYPEIADRLTDLNGLPAALGLVRA
ncbi:MAG: HAD-IIIA family hydrolase [Actinobacteria bacterium]|nr:HAD-IIIA family hydrolase [Actinomycetota bacterium]